MMEKKVLWKAVGIFFGVMALFTVLSRVAYQQGTVVVRTSVPTSGTIDHSVRANGKTAQTQEIAVVTQSGLRVGSVMAAEGQQVKAGDILFCLDMDYLEEKITTQTQELSKQKLTVQEAWSQSSAQAKQKANAKSQAEENYNAAVSGAEDTVNQAKAALESAQKALENYYAGISDDSSQEEQLKKAVQDAEAAVTQAQNELNALELELQNAIQQAIDEAKAAAAQESSQSTEAPENSETPDVQEIPEIQAYSADSVDETAIRQRVEAEYAPRMQAARDKLSAAQTTAEQAKQALANFTPGKRSTEQELLDNVEQAKQAYEQAQKGLSSAKRTYGQAVETASLPDGTSNSGQIGQITYDQMAAELKKLEALRDAGGGRFWPLPTVL